MGLEKSGEDKTGSARAGTGRIWDLAGGVMLSIAVLLLVTAFFATTTRVWCAEQERQGVSVEGYCEKSEEVGKYFFSPDEKIGIEEIELKFFNPTEKSHMKDVKNVFWNARAVFWVILILLSWYFIAGGDIWRVMRVAGTVGIAIVAVVFLVPFEGLFAWFHSLFFEAGTWVFPRESLILQLYPFGFFEKMAMKIVVIYGLISIIMCGIGILIRNVAVHDMKSL